MSSRMDEILDAWDTLMTFTSYERTSERQEWLRRAYEIEGSIDDWLENRFPSVIEEYGSRRDLTFGEAEKELMERPIKPWKSAPKARAPEMVHAAVQGPKNITTFGVAQPRTEEGLKHLAAMVATRKPGRRYYVVTDTMPKQILYRWHVGEGMSHEEGWWVE